MSTTEIAPEKQKGFNGIKTVQEREKEGMRRGERLKTRGANTALSEIGNQLCKSFFKHPTHCRYSCICIFDCIVSVGWLLYLSIGSQKFGNTSQHEILSHSSAQCVLAVNKLCSRMPKYLFRDLHQAV